MTCHDCAHFEQYDKPEKHEDYAVYGRCHKDGDKVLRGGYPVYVPGGKCKDYKPREGGMPVIERLKPMTKSPPLEGQMTMEEWYGQNEGRVLPDYGLRQEAGENRMGKREGGEDMMDYWGGRYDVQVAE